MWTNLAHPQTAQVSEKGDLNHPIGFAAKVFSTSAKRD